MAKEGNLLIVDDNSSILGALRLLLERHFAKVTTLTSPKLLDTALRGEAVDAVLLDMNFTAGVNNGNEGIYWLRRIRDRRPDVKVVLFTAYADVELAVRSMRDGAVDFVVKPWDNERLVAALRNAGGLAAAAALAKGDDCEGVDMICLPEVPFNVEHFIEKVRVMQEKKPSIVIAVSEGVKLEDGRYVCELADDVHAVDAFGHKGLTGTARFLANTVARNLDTKTRCIELSALQRCAGHLTSRTDITEAYQVGGAAAKAAFEGVTGQTVALKRISNRPYQCATELHPISEVANLEKKVPLSWMNENHTQMTEDFLDYARPLIQAELTPLYIAGLPHHIYMKK